MQSTPPPTTRNTEILRFLLAGGTNTAITYAIYLLCGLFTGYQVAYAVAYLAGIGISYVLNSCYVFELPVSWKAFSQYPLVHLGQYLVGALLLEGLVLWMEVPIGLAPLLVVVLTLPMTFVLSKVLLVRGARRP